MSFASFQLATMEVAPQKMPFSRFMMPRAKISFTWRAKAKVSTMAHSLWKKRMAPNPPTSLASLRAQMLWLKRNGRPVAASPRKVVNSTACMVRCARVKRTKKRPVLGAVSWSWTGLWTGDSRTSGMGSSLSAFLHLVVSGTDQPQCRMDHEECQHSNQQQIHEKAHKEERRIELAHARVGVRLILHKADIGAGVTLAAGDHEVSRIHGRMRIGGGPDVVSFVAVPAPRRFYIAAQCAQLRMEGIAIGAELVFVAGAADGRRLHAKSSRGGLLDRMRGVAVRADRSILLSGRDGLAMHAFHV